MLFAPFICSHGTIARATSGGCETAREVEISFASFAWSRAQGSLIGSNSTASQPAPAVITYGKVPASVVRAHVHAWPKFEVIHLLSFRLSSSTTVNSDHQPPLPTHSTGSWARSYPTNSRQFRFHHRAASTSNPLRSTVHRQTNRPSTRTSTPQTHHQSSCPSKLPPPKWQTPPSMSPLPPPRAPPSAPAATSRSTRPRTRPLSPAPLRVGDCISETSPTRPPRES